MADELLVYQDDLIHIGLGEIYANIFLLHKANQAYID